MRGAVEGFYPAESEQTAWGEWYRALAEPASPPMRRHMPRVLRRFDVRVEEVAGPSDTEGSAAGLFVECPLAVSSRLGTRAGGNGAAREGVRKAVGKILVTGASGKYGLPLGFQPPGDLQQDAGETLAVLPGRHP